MARRLKKTAKTSRAMQDAAMTAFQRAYEGWLYEDGSLPLAQQAHELASMAGFTKGNLYEAAADWRFMYDGAMLEEVGLWEEKM